MKAFVKVLISSLCLIVALACTACSSGSSDATSEAEPTVDLHTLHLAIDYKSNLIMAKYDVDVRIDGNPIATIAQGDVLEQDVSLETGKHTIGFYKKDEDSTFAESEFELEEEAYYQCSLKAHLSEIEIVDESFEVAMTRSKRIADEKAAEEKAAEEAALAEAAAAKEKAEAEKKAAAEEAAKQKAADEVKSKLESVALKPTTEVLEYSSKTTDPLKLVECGDPAIEVTPASEIDLAKLGKQDVAFTLTADGQSVQRTVAFDVRDTKKPKIELGEKSVTIEVGDTYDIDGNITSVSDPVDGDLEETDTPPKAAGTKAGEELFYDAGWYVTEGSVDNEKAGKYTIVVRAQDKHGNEATKKFTVKVTEPKSDQASEESNEITYVLNTNSRKFHYPYCASVDDMKPENRLDSTDSREEIVARGYKPCKRCNP